MTSQEIKIKEIEAKCHQKINSLDRRIQENNDTMFESMDFRDQKFGERLKKNTSEIEKLEVILKDSNYKIEKEVCNISNTSYM